MSLPTPAMRGPAPCASASRTSAHARHWSRTVSATTSPTGPTTSTGPQGECSFNYFSHAPGLGMRYHTPVGPIRLDFSYNLNPPIYPIYEDYSHPSSLPHVGRRQSLQLLLQPGADLLMSCTAHIPISACVRQKLANLGSGMPAGRDRAGDCSNAVAIQRGGAGPRRGRRQQSGHPLQRPGRGDAPFCSRTEFRGARTGNASARLAATDQPALIEQQIREEDVQAAEPTPKKSRPAWRDPQGTARLRSPELRHRSRMEGLSGEP